MSDRTPGKTIAVAAVTLRPSRLWRAVAPDGSTWCEASDERDVRSRARPGDIVQQQWTGTVSRWLPAEQREPVTESAAAAGDGPYGEVPPLVLATGPTMKRGTGDTQMRRRTAALRAAIDVLGRNDGWTVDDLVEAAEWIGGLPRTRMVTEDGEP